MEAQGSAQKQATNCGKVGQCLAGRSDGSECHLTTYARKKGFVAISKFSEEDQTLLRLRGSPGPLAEGSPSWKKKILKAESLSFLNI